MRLLFAIPSLLLIAGCATAPLEGPANAPWPVTPPQLEMSTIQIPVHIALETLAREVVASAPKPLVEGSLIEKTVAKPSSALVTPQPVAKPQCEGVIGCMQQKAGVVAAGATQLAKSIGDAVTPTVDANVDYKVFLQELRLTMNGPAVTAVATLDFTVNAHVDGAGRQVPLASCGINEALPRVEVTLPGTVQWLPDTAIGVKTGQWAIRWLKPCNMTALAINMESVLNLPLVRTRISAIINDELQKGTQRIDLKPAVATLWPRLQSPYQVSPGIWLSLRPETVNVGAISGSQSHLDSAVSITARPLINSAASAPATARSTPPAIGASQVGSGFHVALESHVTLDRLNQLLNAQLANKSINANGRTVLIKTLRLYGNEDRAVIGMTLEEPFQGQVYLLARPVYDVISNTLSFDRLDYTLASSSLLTKSASWLLSDSVKSKIAESSRIRFNEDLPKLLGDLKRLNIPLTNSARLQGTLDKLQPSALFFTQDAVHLYLLADGQLELRMEGASPAK